MLPQEFDSSPIAEMTESSYIYQAYAPPVQTPPRYYSSEMVLQEGQAASRPEPFLLTGMSALRPSLSMRSQATMPSPVEGNGRLPSLDDPRSMSPEQILRLEDEERRINEAIAESERLVELRRDR